MLIHIQMIQSQLKVQINWNKSIRWQQWDLNRKQLLLHAAEQQIVLNCVMFQYNSAESCSVGSTTFGSAVIVLLQTPLEYDDGLNIVSAQWISGDFMVQQYLWWCHHDVCTPARYRKT